MSPELSSQPPPSTPEEVAEEAHRLLGDGPRCGASGPSPALPACGVLHRAEVERGAAQGCTGVLHRAEVAWAAAQGVARGVARPRPGGRAGGWSSCCPRRWPPPSAPPALCCFSLDPPGRGPTPLLPVDVDAGHRAGTSCHTLASHCGHSSLTDRCGRPPPEASPGASAPAASA